MEWGGQIGLKLLQFENLGFSWALRSIQASRVKRPRFSRNCQRVEFCLFFIFNLKNKFLFQNLTEIYSPDPLQDGTYKSPYDRAIHVAVQPLEGHAVVILHTAPSRSPLGRFIARRGAQAKFLWCASCISKILLMSQTKSPQWRARRGSLAKLPRHASLVGCYVTWITLLQGDLYARPMQGRQGNLYAPTKQ